MFGLRHNQPDETVAEVFGCSQATITRSHQILQPVLRWVTRPEVNQRLEQTRREGVPVDGFVAPVDEREAYHGLFSGKKHVCGQNVQVIANLDGRVADVGDPVDGARHDAAAFHISGITQRWADHLAPGGPGMIGDGGHQGTGPTTPHRKPPGGELTATQKAYNYSVNRLPPPSNAPSATRRTGRSSRPATTRS
nr:transposase family protein [Micromonospora sp. HNM0581]